MNTYKLLTPGPLTTSTTVKEAMLFDRCTWDEEYKKITQKIRRQLLAVAAVSEEDYTAVLLQGSGSFGVEAVLTTTMNENDKCLFISNGAYGERMIAMAKRLGLAHTACSFPYDQLPAAKKIRDILETDPAITKVAVVHCETTTGILNPLEEVAALAREYGKTLIVDAMSSFGGIKISVSQLGIDFLISSANKCIQGVPGFCFVIAKRAALTACRGYSRSISLDLYDQWKHMEQDGKWRFTSPTHVVAAFSQALDELEEEGGVAARQQRYETNNRLLRSKLILLGFEPYISATVQSPIITTFRYPDASFKFVEFYHFVKQQGFVLYPGKLTDADTFRVGNIGEIYESDINKLCEVITRYCKGERHA